MSAPPLVLIVEDTRTIARLLQIYLGGQGLTFEVATTGRKGLRAALASKPDLVLSDVQMPDMDGFELCAALRGDPGLSELPIVLLSAHDEATRARAREVGATACLGKPVSATELRALVAGLLQLDPRGS